MTVITHARRKSNLSRMIDSSGGVSVGVALTRARENIAALRETGLVEIRRYIAELSALQAPTDDDEKLRVLHQMYQAATGVIDSASPFDLGEICDVARSLCDVIDRAAGETVFDWRIMAVHIQSLQLLNTLPAEAVEQRQAVTTNLADMVAKKFRQTGA